MILYGASGHAKVISDVLKDNGHQLVHFFDDNSSIKEFSGIDVTQYDVNMHTNEHLIISIGNNLHRKNIAEKLKHKLGTIIHSSVIISDSVKISDGTVLLHNSTVQADTIVGKHCIINTASTVDHDCYIHDFVHISPNATICGTVTIGEGTHVGAGAILLPNISIGKWCVIGAGSVVLNDIPDNSVVVGNPGRIIKQAKDE